MTIPVLCDVPVLWDKKKKTTVSDESADIIRVLNHAFDNGDGNADLDFWSQAKRDAIEEINQPVYENVNNGVYHTGFATKQGAYDEAVNALFDTLDMLESKLADQRYLARN